MGLPAAASDPPQSADPKPDPMPTNITEATVDPSNVNTLPPAALELASRLFDLAREGDTAQLRQYLDAGIPPNLTNSTGDTLIMLSAYHGHAETVQMLVGKNADPNVVNGRGQSPLAGAVFKGFEDVVGVLVGAGADIYGGRPSAVDAARMFRREGCCRILGVEMGEGGGEMPPGMIPGAPPT